MLFYFVLKKNIEKEYIARYHSLGMMIGDTFKQLEVLTDKLNNNAAQALSVIEKEKGLPSNEELIRLRDQLGISSLHVANSNGIIIRTTDHFPPVLAENLFNFCGDYRLLISGNKALYATPIVPDSFYNTPSKFILIPSHNRKLILESGTQLPYIGKILAHVLSNDKNVKSIGFYGPTGAELGFISRSGIYSDAAKKIKLNHTLSEKMNKNEFFFNIKISTTEKYCCECVNKKIATASGEYFYIVHIKVSRDSLVESIHYLRNKIFLILIAACLLSLLIAKHLSVKLVSRIKKINKIANEIIKSNNLDLHVGVEGIDDEISELANTFNKMIKFLKESQVALVRSEKKISLLDLAAKVAHDIRSPIAVMEINLQMILKEIPENQAKMFSAAIQSIRDIANNLLGYYRNENIVDIIEKGLLLFKDDGNVLRQLLLFTLVDGVVSQKRQEWTDANCELSLLVFPDVRYAWLDTAPSEFKSILSNLLNNAYEAIKEQGKIEVNLSKKDNFLLVKIVDNGLGMDADKIPLVLNGLSLKHSGKGLGLSEAKKYMEKLGGKLQLFSQINKGTEVVLSFPYYKTPDWFPQKITLINIKNILILDDNSLMQSFWDNKLQDYNGIIQQFTNCDDAIGWCDLHSDLLQNTVFLVDYELIDKAKNGLDFLEHVGAGDNGYLITSHFEQIFIQKKVNGLGVWLIPKELVNDLPIVY